MRSSPLFPRSSAGIGAAAVIALALTACASNKDAPKSELATAEDAVNRVVSTPTVATAAPIEMQSARDKLARAQRAMANEDYDEARRYAEEARVDARLAESKVAADRSERALQEIRQSIRESNTGTRPGAVVAPAPSTPR